jgi:predicted ATP-grasp superfamily ATP-dependent carboligase
MSSKQRGKKKPYAVVIGLDHMNGIQTARILARHDVPVIAIAKDPKHYCCRTNVCERIVFTDTATDTLITTLETMGPELEEKAVLFPCTDTTVLLVSRNRHRLEAWYHIVLPSAEVVEMMMDKVRFYTYAQENDFPIPRTVFLNSQEDADRATDELTFPCVIKPPISATQEWEQNSKLKAYLVSNAEDFLAVYRRYGEYADMLIAQEYIEGTSSNLYSCNCYFDGKSEPVATFVARKLRQWPPETGESCLGEECRNDEVLQGTLNLFKSVNYRGLGYVEMKQDARNGKHYIMEPNIGRPTGRSAIAEAGGVDLLYTMYCDALDWPLPEERFQQYGNAKWIHLRRDMQSAIYYWRRGELTIGDWWRSVRGRKVDALFAWYDPGPFLGDLLRAARLFLSAEERRKRDYSSPFS